MKNLKIPEISKREQQCTFGAYGDSTSDPTYDGGWLDTVYIGGGGSGGSGGGTGGDSGGGYPGGEYGPGGPGDDYGGGGGGGAGDGDQTQDGEWGVSDFFDHYNNGSGAPTTLSELGYEDDIRESQEYKDMLDRVNDQVEQSIADYIEHYGIQPNSSGPVSYNWVNSYDFTGDAFVIGSATVGGEVTGSFTTDSNGNVTWQGDVDVNFKDTFEDPWDVFDITDGTWDTGTPFDINGNWGEQMNGNINNSPDIILGPSYDYEYGY